MSARLLRIARVLNAFNILEGTALATLLYFLYLYVKVYVDYLDHLIEVNSLIVSGSNIDPNVLMTIDTVAYFGAIVAIVGAIIGLVKYIYHTGVDIKD